MMRLYKIAVHGDNDELHRQALARAVEAIEAAPTQSVYRAWVDPVEEWGVDARLPVAIVR
jgi:hypothetical protein